MEFKEMLQIKWDFENTAYGADEHHKFDIIIPKEKDVHAIVYIHGGAYLTGNKLQYPSFLSHYSKSNVIASIDYRIIEKDNTVNMADILSDVNAALEKIIEVSKANGVNIKDFILVGHSAGGHIGLLYGYTLQKNTKIRVAACISLAGPADFTDDLGWSSMTMWGEDVATRLLFLSQMGSRLTGHTIELKQHNWTKQKNYSAFEPHIREISPITYVSRTGQIPTTLLVHARGDNQVPYSNAIRLNNALNGTSVPHKLITPVGSANNHMLGGEVYTSSMPTIYREQAWLNEAKRWLETYLK
jgi:acetyl esterase/lipase